MSEQPSAIIPYDGPPLTEEQLADLRERLAAILASPASARAQRRSTLRLLSRRTRLRLWYARRVDGVAIWLCDHGHPGAAEALWRLSGLWRAR